MDGAGRHLIVAERQQRCHEDAAIAGFYVARKVSLGITDRHKCRDGVAAGISGSAANDAGGSLRLGVKRDGSDGERREE